VTPSSASPARKPRSAPAANRFDWRRIAYHVLVSRAVDDAEELTNKNKATVPREHLVL
jgi:2-oxoisovalerate dehydrogenase E1 component